MRTFGAGRYSGSASGSARLSLSLQFHHEAQRVPRIGDEAGDPIAVGDFGFAREAAQQTPGAEVRGIYQIASVRELSSLWSTP